MSSVTFDSFLYTVRAEVHLDLKVVYRLSELSHNHYDYKCRELSAEGGKVHGWLNWMTVTESDHVVAQIDLMEADLICKVFEAEMYLKRMQPEIEEYAPEFRALFDRIRDEQGKVGR